MNGGPSGFNNAPVTRIFVIASALLTILFGVRGRSLRLGLSYQDIFQKFRLWKLISSVLAFSSTPELMFGVYLIYYFRVFERQIGSNKHTVFILFSVIVSLLIEVLAIAYLRDPSSTLASGPYSLIFASFVPFYFDIPVSSRFRIFGIQLTDKSFVYMAGLQLLFSSWKRSLVPGICGVLAGSLYHLNAFGIRKIKIPDFVTSFFSRSSRPPSGTSHNLPSRTTMQNVSSYSSRQVEGFQGSFPSAAHVSVQEPSEASVAILVSMGFDSSSARQALMHARNDVHVATNILLESQS